MSERLTDAELRLFRELLKRFCETALDQWELWRTDASHGTAYIEISRHPAQGSTRDSYTAL